MSGICGFINLDGSPASAGVGAAMMNMLGIYNSEASETWFDGQAFLGCLLQRISPESYFEKLPYNDADSALTITADAIIDNRIELLHAFGIKKEIWDNTPDSELILLAYKKWGYECPRYLIGDFAFVIWDKRKKELFCARDHVGTRTLYYTSTNRVFAFCTIEKPLFEVLANPIELNEKWITDFLAIDGIQHEIEYEETVYKGIYQIPPAYTGIISSKGFEKRKYWDPIKEMKPILFKTDREYEDAFNKVFFEAVACRLRSSGGVGIMLSGGLDSGSIASVAAREMSKEDKKLFAFCSVPMEGFNEELSERIVSDERNEVELVVNKYKNIEIEYCRTEEKNALSNVDGLIRLFEQPYKIFQNIPWYQNILGKAIQKNCRVILNGQVGNSTISYGDFSVHLRTLFKKGQLISFFREITALSKLINVPIKKVFKRSVKVVLPNWVRSCAARTRNKKFDRFANTLARQDLIKKWSVETRLDKHDANLIINRYIDFNEDNKRRVSPLAFTHIGAIETKLSLANGIAIRDPSRDRRVIEFCLAVPPEQYVRNGLDRYLLRRAMKGILPDKIRLNFSTRGLQSADWLQRLEPDWESMRAEIEKIIADENIRRYVDVDKLKGEFSKDNGVFEKKDEDMARKVIIAIIFSRFLSDFNEKSSGDLARVSN